MLRVSRQTECNSYIPQPSHFQAHQQHMFARNMGAFSIRQWFCFLTNLQVVAFASPIPCLLLPLFAVSLIWKKKICHTDKHNVIMNRAETHNAQGMRMWFANKEEKVRFELLRAHSWCHAALSHILLTRLGIYDISSDIARACPLAVARQHAHNRPDNRCCLELMKGKCREACLPQPANQLLPTSTDSNSTTITTTHWTLHIDMPLTLCKFFWNRMSPSQLLTRLWELDCGADLVVICGPGRETVLRSNGWRLPHTYAAHIEAQITDFS